MMTNRRYCGFTLVELMVVVAIMSILTAIAIPIYQNQLTKGRRAAAQAEMMEISSLQEQYLLASRSYVTHTDLAGNGYSLPDDVSDFYSYTVAVSTSSIPGFTITFTPTGTQAGDGSLTLNNYGVKTPASKW